jgi:hypothetical protein
VSLRLLYNGGTKSQEVVADTYQFIKQKTKLCREISQIEQEGMILIQPFHT